ncbi:MAG: hypothetical protein PHO56_05500 [Patescibacteria group bacterium]|nr:hypothetical protein [Patescibacteria group bacterium]
MKLLRCLVVVVILASFSCSWAADSPWNAVKKYENVIGDMLDYVHAQSYGRNLSFDRYDAMLKSKLLRLFERCMTGDFLEEGKQRIENALTNGSHLAGSDYWYVTFVPASIATDLHREVLENAPDKKVYSFRGRRGNTEFNQKVTVIKTDKGWRISEFEHPEEN